MRWVIAASTLLLGVSWLGGAQAQPLEVSFRTAPTDGRYYPAHVMAAWVTSEDGTFERTLYVWGRRRRRHLSEWGAAHPSSEVLDGITRATLRVDSTQTFAWDLRDTTGAFVPYGTYLLHFELADTNSTASNYRREFSFARDTEPFDVTLEDSPFLDVHIVYNPSAEDVPAPAPPDAGNPVDTQQWTPVGRGYGSRCAVSSSGVPRPRSALWWVAAVIVGRLRRNGSRRVRRSSSRRRGGALTRTDCASKTDSPGRPSPTGHRTDLGQDGAAGYASPGES